MTARELANLKRPSRWFSFKHGTIDAFELVEQYQLGKSINRLAFELAASEKRVRRILQTHGVQIRTQAQASDRHIPIQLAAEFLEEDRLQLEKAVDKTQVERTRRWRDKQVQRGIKPVTVQCPEDRIDELKALVKKWRKSSKKWPN